VSTLNVCDNDIDVFDVSHLFLSIISAVLYIPHIHGIGYDSVCLQTSPSTWFIVYNATTTASVF